MRTPLARSLFVSLSCLSILAVHAEDAAVPVKELSKISVSATRGPRELDSVAGTVTVKTSEEIERELAADIRDLIRYEPGISVSNSPARFGLAGFNIRGIDGNRVLVRIDDVRMADAFAIGSFSDARRNLVDLETLKSVEIVRGAASALYGSDALGGVVSFVTKDPLDYLEPGKSIAAVVRSGYQSDDEGWFAGGTLALGDEGFSGLLQYTRREGHETDNQGSVSAPDRTRTAPNPQDRDSDSVLAKVIWNPNESNSLRLSLEADRGDVFSNVLSSVGVASGINTVSMRGQDRQERTRVALSHDWRVDATAFDALEWRVYVQDSEVTQRTLEQRYSVAAGSAATVLRDRKFTYEQSLRGVEAVLHKAFTAGSSEQLLTYGVEATWTDTEQMRNGVQTALTTGVQTSTIVPDVFPVRDFPKTRTRQLAAYVQDEISFADGVWTVVPGVRIDSYDLDARPDAIFIADNPAVTTSDIDETSVTPKLGIVRTLGEHYSAFAQYSRGFRAPPYNDVNIGFTNLAFGYTAIANPDLKPETSNGYEIGLRGGAGDSYFALSAYYNEYDDFIESLSFVGIQGGLQVFQSRNLSEATIYGAELRSGLALNSLASALEAWRVKFSAAYARGKNRVTDAPLNSVDPLKAVLGIAFEPQGGRWGVELAGTAVRRKSQVDQSTGPAFIPPGYFTLDLLAHADIGERLRINAGVFNLTDKKYWDWTDVRGRPAGDAVIERFTRSGLNASASATVRF